MSDIQALANYLQEHWGNKIQSSEIALGELTVELLPEHLIEICHNLKTDPLCAFEILVDLAGVDYLHYGLSEWATTSATRAGFSRGVQEASTLETKWHKPRFAVVYHLLSITHNHRIRLKTFITAESLKVPSITSIWNSANWYEREAFDLFGIIFEGHPDLRRLLTDYGFIGHPFRKDFPLIGTVEMRYSAEAERVIYEPVSIEPRTLVPKTIRSDHRYEKEEGKK